ncbi:hypothetical protein BB558_004880, partial [Smittium angustum]
MKTYFSKIALVSLVAHSFNKRIVVIANPEFENANSTPVNDLIQKNDFIRKYTPIVYSTITATSSAPIHNAYNNDKSVVISDDKENKAADNYVSTKVAMPIYEVNTLITNDFEKISKQIPTKINGVNHANAKRQIAPEANNEKKSSSSSSSSRSSSTSKTSSSSSPSRSSSANSSSSSSSSSSSKSPSLSSSSLRSSSLSSSSSGSSSSRSSSASSSSSKSSSASSSSSSSSPSSSSS